MARRNRNDVTKFMTNRKMNDDTYQLRRKVMAHVYVAKALLANVGYALPRIDVRIGDSGNTTLGVARMGKAIIWIDAAVVGKPYLRQVVWHELCHAVAATEHDENCPLMSPVLNTLLSDSEADRLLIQHITK